MFTVPRPGAAAEVGLYDRVSGVNGQNVVGVGGVLVEKPNGIARVGMGAARIRQDVMIVDDGMQSRTKVSAGFSLS